MDYLSKMNKHEKDDNIDLDEKTHTYNVKGDTKFTSVTKWVHSHFKPFDADKVIDNIMKGKNWENSQYYGKTKPEIKKLWKNNGIEAAKEGTKLHYDIECYYNKVKVNKHSENTSIEYKHFMNFVQDNSHLKPWRTEMKVYCQDLKLAGSIDMIFENDDGTLMIYDWKRCKEIKTTAFYNQTSTTECINHIPDCNFWQYSLQLNTYKGIIERDYGKVVSGMALVCFYPEMENYKVFKVPNLENEINELFALRKTQL